MTRIVTFVPADPAAGDEMMDSVLVVEHRNTHWTFVFAMDPGLSRAYAPDGRVLDAYDPFGEPPAGIPADLWQVVERFFEEQF